MVFLALVLVGCDPGVSDDPEEMEGPSLDEQLVDLITIGGQRGLGNFILPDPSDLGAIPQDPLNPLTTEKVALGRLLFHETAMASNPLREEAQGTYSCATCHHSGAGFQAGRRQAMGEGGTGWGQNGEGRQKKSTYSDEEVDVQSIRTPSILNSPYQEVTGWTGKFGVSGPNRGTEAQWIAGTPTGVNALGYDG
ncbi:MAG: cytochrome c peroxidase, partial [Rhodothermales bacterium]